MTITVTPITLPGLTTAAVDGTGVFDVLMKSMKEHLEIEFNKNRLKGPEYAAVYIKALESVMQTSLAFLLQKDKATLDAELVKQQLLLSSAQTELALQQLANLISEGLNIPKQGLKIDADAAVSTQQKLNLVAEASNITAKTVLTTQQSLNSVIEGEVSTAQKCKLQAEFDLVMASKLKTDQETLLLQWKVSSEKGQTLSVGVDENSVLGKQKALYAAQTAGFTRDAEQKAAKIMVDTWNTRRMTDEGTVADSTNLLNDVTVGRAVTKLLAGVSA
jgi:hypothetical protein